MMFLLRRLGLILLAFVCAAPVVAQTSSQMIQCESCSSSSQMEQVARPNGEGRYYVFSLQNELIVRVDVQYDHELHQHLVYTRPAGATMESAFSHMVEANEAKPNIFVGSQAIKVDISRLGGGPHDPVKISVNGEHDSAYGAFIHYADSCLDSSACAASLHPALDNLTTAERILNGVGLSLTGANFSWENLPPNFKLWLCNANQDCALIRYENREWKYIESRAGGGLGKRYPKYGENLNYQFNGLGEASAFNHGLRSAGIPVRGTYQTRTILACVSTGGSLSCEYVTVPE